MSAIGDVARSGCMSDSCVTAVRTLNELRGRLPALLADRAGESASLRVEVEDRLGRIVSQLISEQRARCVRLDRAVEGIDDVIELTRMAVVRGVIGAERLVGQLQIVRELIVLMEADIADLSVSD